MAIFIGNKLPKTIGLGISFTKSFISKFLTWGKSAPARFWGTTSPEFWGVTESVEIVIEQFKNRVIADGGIFEAQACMTAQIQSLFDIQSNIPIGIDVQAQEHFNRVIADGGVIPAGFDGVNSFFQLVKSVYNTTDINTAISAAYDAHYLGYKLGAGSGTTLGQAAQKMYAPKGIFGGIGTGSAFWEGVGVTSNYVSTPDSAANNNNGNKQIDIKFSTNVTSGSSDFVSKDNVGANRAYAITYDHSNQRFSIVITTDLTATKVVNTDIGTILRNYAGTYRVTFVFSGGILTIRTFQSLDGINFTEVGTAKTENGNNFIGTNAILNIGTRSVSSGSCSANIFRVTIANSIGGTPVVDFNANQYIGANTWTSTTSEVWTVNSTGAGLADVTQTTAASQPLLLAHTGENYWWGSGVSGNYVSTPNAAANQITGDIDIQQKICIADWTSVVSFNPLISKYNGANRAWLPYIVKTGKKVGYIFKVGASTIGAEPAGALPFGNNDIFWVRMTRTQSDGVITCFYKQNDNDSWTQLWQVTDTSGALSNPSISVDVGFDGSGAVNTALMKVYRATISNSIGGTPVVDFNPASYNPSVSQTQWTSATGEVWSINTDTATTGYKGVLVDRTIVQGDGVDDRLVTGTLTSYQYMTRYVALTPYTNSSAGQRYVAGTSSGHLLYNFNTGIVRAFNGVDLEFNNEVINRLQLFTSNFNNLSSSTLLNNANLVSGASGTNTSTIISLLSNSTPSQFANGNLTTIIQTISVDTTNNTAIYDVIRRFNNNAF